jgi:hypothetical protein
MKTSEFLLGVATLIVVTVVVVWIAHRVWYDGRNWWKLSSSEPPDDDPVLWI